MNWDLATPRHHTPRDNSAATYGEAVDKVSRTLKGPLKRWQRHAYDVGLELDPVTGRWKYHTVLISVPRQAGKTYGFMSVGLHRTLIQPGGRVWYTAQTGQAARERWVKDCATPAMRTMGKLLKTKLGAGDTRLIVPSTDAQFRPMPPTGDYLHGEQSDLVGIDETWAHSVAAGTALLQAVVPTMTTRHEIGHGPQTWYFSTMGDGNSTWWHDMLDRAIEDPAPGVAVIDYGIGDDVDPTDLDAVYRAHPAAGEGLTMKALEDAAESLSPSEFARAYGNRRTKVTNAVFTSAAIDAATTDKPLDDGVVHIGVAVSWDHDMTSIVAAGTIDGTPAVEVIESRPGQAWAVDMVKAIHRLHHPSSIRVDAHGPSGHLAEELTAALGDSVVCRASIDDLIQTTDYMLTAIPEERLLLRRAPEFPAELAAVALRTIGDKGRVLDRKHSRGSVATIEAALLALRGVRSIHPTMPAPTIWSPSYDEN